MYNISVSPHIRDKSSTQKIMLDVFIALLPTLCFGAFRFGLKAAMIIIVSIVSSVLFEFLYEILTKQKITIFDFSAAVTGAILALNMPPTVSWWIPVLGSAFAIIIVKMLFGGIGQNFINPALAARCFLLISFTSRMNTFIAIDGTSSATPLATLKNGGEVNLLDLFIGNQAGCIGEVSIFCILIGFIYLLIKKVISPRIPLFVIGSALVFITIISLIKGNNVSPNFIIGELCAGGLVSGAVFMATDYTTSPMTKNGQIIYSVLIGFLVALFRIQGSSSEGMSYAIIISNLLVPLIEKITIPKAFGMRRKEEV